MDTFRFKHFQVYKDAKELNKKIYFLSKKFPIEIRSQLIRCSLSVLLNIAEGSAKKSDRDFNRYITNSLGSINELVAILDITLSINLSKLEEVDEMELMAKNIAKQLGGLSKKLCLKS